MAVWKISLLFNQGRAGWSESWYSDDTVGANPEQVAPALLVARNKLCGSGAYAEAYRITDTERLGNVTVSSTGFAVETSALAVDVASNIVLAQVTNGTKYRRPVYLRGVPDEWIVRSDTRMEVEPSPDARLAFNSFLNFLIGEKIGFRTYSREGALGDGVDIGRWSETAGLGLTFKCAGLAAVAGDRVMIRRVKGAVPADARKVNRSWYPVALGGDEYALPLSAEDVPSFAALAGGKAYIRRSIFRAVVAGSLVRIASRKIGRAFFAPRGRRSRGR